MIVFFVDSKTLSLFVVFIYISKPSYVIKVWWRIHSGISSCCQGCYDRLFTKSETSCSSGLRSREVVKHIVCFAASSKEPFAFWKMCISDGMLPGCWWLELRNLTNISPHKVCKCMCELFVPDDLFPLHAVRMGFLFGHVNFFNVLQLK